MPIEFKNNGFCKTGQINSQWPTIGYKVVLLYFIQNTK